MRAIPGEITALRLRAGVQETMTRPANLRQAAAKMILTQQHSQVCGV